MCSECRFLVESELSVLVEPLEENERRLILLDAIFSALNIDSEEELTRLVQSLINNKAVTEDGSDPNLAFKVSLKPFSMKYFPPTLAGDPF